MIRHGSHSFTDKKFQDFEGPHKKIVQNLFEACKFSNMKKKGIYLQYSECSPLQKIQHKAKCGKINQHSTLYLSKQ